MISKNEMPHENTYWWSVQNVYYLQPMGFDIKLNGGGSLQETDVESKKKGIK